MALDDRLKAVRRFVARPAREATGSNSGAFEDSVQEGVIAAWKLLQETPEAPLSWALRSAKFAAINAARGRRHTGAPERTKMSAPTQSVASLEEITEAHDEEGYAIPAVFVTDPWGSEIDGLDVRGALARLCEEDRRLVWLRFWEGRSEADTAQVLGISRSLVSYRWTYRIVPALRVALVADAA